jgi:parallel beta-helix repeat protein
LGTATFPVVFWGIYVSGTNNIIRNNDCSNGGHAIAVSGAGNRFLNNDVSESQFALSVSGGVEEVSGNDIGNSGYGLRLTSSSAAKVFHSNILNNVYGKVIPDRPIELSFNGEGDYWGHSCPDPLFVAGKDSKRPDVVDSHPYAALDGWLGGGAPGCNQPPDCSQAYPSSTELWPPNHKMVDIAILGVSDPDGDAVTLTVTQITQDESVDDAGDGHFEPDGAGIGTSAAQVRAERTGDNGNGRVYTIAFIADDGQGGTRAGGFQRRVPIPSDCRWREIRHSPAYAAVEVGVTSDLRR